MLESSLKPTAVTIGERLRDTERGHSRRETARYGAQATVAPHAQKNDPMPLANQTDSLCQRTRPVTGFGSDSNLFQKPSAFIITDLTPVVHWHTTATDPTDCEQHATTCHRLT